MRRIHLFVLFLLAAGVPAAVPADDLAARSRQGKELMAAGRFAEAVPVYRALAAAMPGNAGLLLNLGMALHMSGDDAGALGPLAEAERVDPALTPASLFLGIVNVKLGRPEQAIAPLQKVVRRDPTDRDARSMLAEALVGAGRYADALPHLRRLTRMAPRDPGAWFNLGSAYEELAGRLVARLVEEHPDSAFTMAVAAEARARSGQPAAAFHLYRQAMAAAKPAIRGLHRAVADIYRGAGHAAWAEIEARKEQLLPKADCLREGAECAFGAGQYQAAIAATAGRDDPPSLYWRARAYDRLATQAYERLGALPPSALFHERTAQARRNERRHAEAAEHWRKAIALAPQDARLRMELAVTLRQQRDLEGAQRVLDELLAAAPEAADLNYFVGDVLLARDQPANAIPFLEKAVRLEPDAPHAHGALGRAYALVGRPADAIAHLKRSLPADVDGSLRYQLARSYQAAGHEDEARQALEDYEAFRKSRASAETGDEPAITPPQ